MKLLSVIIRVSLIAMVVTTPWFFGGVWAIAQWSLLLVASVLIAADLVSRFGRYDPTNWLPTAWLPLLFGILLGIGQLVPLSPSLAGMLAPKMAELKRELTAPASLPNEARSLDSKITRTLSVAPTREYLALLMLAMGVFILSSTHLVDRRSLIQLFSAVAIGGALLAFFGIIQRLSWNGEFYWFIPTTIGNFTSFGPFVNRNNAGGFMNICLAASLGLIVVLHWKRNPKAESSRVVNRKRVSGSSSKKDGSRNRRESGLSSDPSRPEPSSAKTEPKSTSAERTDAPSPNQDKNSELDERAARYAAMIEGKNPKEVEKKHAKSPTAPERRRVRIREKVKVTFSEEEARTAEFNRSVKGSSYSVVKNNQPIVIKISSFFSEYVGSVNAQKMWAITLCVFLVGGVICTASRGSILALIGATLITAAAFAGTTGKRSFAIGLLVVLLVGSGLMAWAGQTEFVQERMAQLFDDSNLETGRVPNWQESLRSVPDHWVWGAGLGSYRYIYERFQHRFLSESAHFHAENQFIQALVEGGVIALTLLILILFLTGFAIYRLFRTGTMINTALATAGCFALSSQMIGGSFDFGLYIPSNCMLMAAICGVVIGRAVLVTQIQDLDAIEEATAKTSRVSSRNGYRIDEVKYAESPSADFQLHGGVVAKRSSSARSMGVGRLLIRLPVPGFVLPAIVGFVLLGSLFGSLEMHKAAVVENTTHKAPLRDVRKSDNVELIESVITDLKLAVARRWDDANAHRHLSELYQHLYHAKRYRQLAAQQEPRVPERSVERESKDADLQRDESIWRRASIWHLHETVRKHQQAGNELEVKKLLTDPIASEYLGMAVHHMTFARQFCPTIPYVHFALAELSVMPSRESNELVHLNRAKLLSPADATLLYWCGAIALNSGRVQDACTDWHKSLSISALHFDDIVANSQRRLTRREMIYDAIPNHAGLLLRLAQRYKNHKGYRKHILDRAKKVIDETNLPSGQLNYTAGMIYRMSGENQTAIPFFEKAIRTAHKAGWHFELAKAYFDSDRFEEAAKQAERAFALRPSNVYRDFQQKSLKEHYKTQKAKAPTDDPDNNPSST